ncbi:hypothetical protein [Tabrizicola sp.]|uniref:hypothetical protein n=1 Tax=Tabrizicola sp. TaxID=2005166 RepID=UPI003F2DF1E8
MVYVLVTGLELKSALRDPAFWWHAMRSMAQARAALGLISADVRQINDIRYTLTIWYNEAAMRAYFVTGAHLAAMKAFHGNAAGTILGFTGDTAPGWDEVHEIWQSEAREVRQRGRG